MFRITRVVINTLITFAIIFPSNMIYAASDNKVPSQEAIASTTGIFRTLVSLENENRHARLDDIGVKVLKDGPDWALVLVNADQLETLSRLGFKPTNTEDLGSLVQAHANHLPWLATSLQPQLNQAAVLWDQVQAIEQEMGLSLDEGPQPDIVVALDGLNEIGESLDDAQSAAVTGLISPDDDGDGLTNTQESWWCTDPLNPDSDNDGASDGEEVQAAKDWLGNKTGSYPSTGKPFVGWPPDHAGCYDDDLDSIPDQAERWELGLNMNRESTDRDKFDDGQELFGLTHCPGGGYCGYGALPRDGDWGIIFAEMPSWVKPPGNHPFVAAFPIPSIDILPSSLHVETITEITTDHTISEGTERSYSTTKLEGTSTSIANTTTWNEWEEISDATTTPTYDYALLSPQTQNSLSSSLNNYNSNTVIVQQPAPKSSPLTLVDNLVSLVEAPGKVWNAGTKIGEGIGEAIYLTSAYGAPWNWTGHMDENEEMQARVNLRKCERGETCRDPATGVLLLDGGQYALNPQENGQPSQDYVTGNSGIRTELNNSGATSYPYYPINVSVNMPPTKTHTETKGRSWGGSETTTNTQYEEHSVTNGEAFSNGEAWGTATAIDAAHAANLRFSYKIHNNGTEYAREICNLTFNLYIGDNKNPDHSYFVADDLGGDGCFENFMPNEEHTYTSQPIPLSLDQMKLIDLWGTVRIVVEDFTYGIDELFYEDAANSNVMIAMEDGVDDGDESIETYLIPTWGEETTLDVLTRYFPYIVDENDIVNSIWSPEYRLDTPLWCHDPQHTGSTLWCKHVLSTADWWNVYVNGMGDGMQGFQDIPATSGSTALFRFNKDNDLDGYSDRSEIRLNTDPNDAEDFPNPELIAGLHSTQSGSDVTATLSLLNTGLYDAFGIEAVIIAPNDSISITNNIIGGSGRVRAQKQVVVGSHILLESPLPSSWDQSGHARPAVGGYYTGDEDRAYTFTVNCDNPGGCDVSSGIWTLDWDDGSGSSSSIDIGSGYNSPNLLDVGSFGVKIGLISGRAYNGESFLLEARTPRDTFQYTINSEPHSEPVVIVSYNDPQGNHRFVIPSEAIELGVPTDNLISYSGEMLPDVGVEIVTIGDFTHGSNTTDLVINNPSDATFADTNLFLEFIDPEGTVVDEVRVTTTLPPGPSVVSITWDSGSFSPAYQSDQDYIVMAFWTDYQGNILDTAVRPLSSFQSDPRPDSDMDIGDELWDFSTAQQGTLLQREVILASIGYMDLLTYLEESTGVTVDGPSSLAIAPADTAEYTLTLNTQYLPVGPFEETIEVRTSDPENPIRTITIRGNVTPMLEDAPGGDILRPLDWTENISGAYNQGEWYEFSHTLGPDPQSLHPIKVFSEDYTTPWGVGKYATDFGEGTASYDMFGDGHNGPLTISSNTTDSPIDASCFGTAGTSTLNASNASFDDPGAKILIHQTRGTNAGVWEINEIVSYTSGIITTKDPLENTYTDGGASQAQVLVLREYTDITVNSGATWSSKSWNGNVGGILAFLANGTVTVNGSILASAKGFRGGNGASAGSRQGRQGEGSTGTGGASRSANNSGGGGGVPDTYAGDGGGGGGGGSHAAVGSDGTAKNNGYGGYGATTLTGSSDLSAATFGGGGGEGGADDGGSIGRGGNGGGLIYISGATVLLNNSTGSIVTNGENGVDLGGAPSGQSGGDGGGSGGSLFINTKTASLGSSRLTAKGGTGSAYMGGDGIGGNGGIGRIRIEYCDSLTGSTNPSASSQKLDCYIVEQIESSPYDNARLNIPETFSDRQTYKVQYGRRYEFAGAGDQTLSIRVPKQIYADASLDVLVSNTGISSGTLDLSLDIGDDATVDWNYNETTDFPAELEATGIVDTINAYLVSQDSTTWGADVNVPVKILINRQAEVILTDLVLSLQFNQPDAPQGAPISSGADLPLDWTAVIEGPHNQGDWVEFNHTLGPDPQTIHPIKVYDQDYTTLWGVGKYVTDFGEGTASYDMFGDGRDGDLVISSNTTDSPIDSSCSGTADSNSFSATNPSFTSGQKILIHQSRGIGAGNWEINEIASYTAGTITTINPLDHTYTDGGANQAQVIVVNQYINVTVNSGVTWAAKAWNGNAGGILTFLANGTISVNGMIDALGKGFRGGNAPGQSGSNHGNTGEGTVGASLYGQQSSNGNGGGAGLARIDLLRAGGGGGGHGTLGSNGGQPSQGNGSPGFGGNVDGNLGLTSMVLGGGGGTGPGDSNDAGQVAGNGGGIVFVAGKIITVSGSIVNSGMPAINTSEAGPGGGGSGGSILLRTSQATLGPSLISVLHGTGGLSSGTGARGGNGGVGRVRVEYCDSISGMTNPPASTQKLDCHIAEQIETDPYNQARLNLPESFTDGRLYKIQFGRRFVFTTSGQQTNQLRMARQMYGSAELDLLVSNTGTSSGSLNLSLDIDDDGNVDWNHNATTDFPATLQASGLENALNEYMLTRDDVPWGDPVDVPVAVQIDRQADVILTNLALTPSGAKTRFLRLPALDYSDVQVSFKFTHPSEPSGPFSFSLDVGADGQVDWSYAGDTDFPAIITTDNLATAFNSYLSGRSGEVDVPLRIIPSPFLDTYLESFSATPTNLSDLTLNSDDITFSSGTPVESDTVTVYANIHNSGGMESRISSAAFYGTAPGWGEWYIGSALVPAIPSGGNTQVSISWNTLGFTGDVPVSVSADPYNRLPENSDANNDASNSLTILTRPDLQVSSIEPSEPEPLENQAVNVTVNMENSGQTAAGSSTLTLYDGDPQNGGELLGETSLEAAAESSQPVEFPWTPSGLGPHRLFTVSDSNGSVSESDEGNNQTWLDAYVGLPGPVMLDSGQAGEPEYSDELGYGFVDEGQPDSQATCDSGTLPSETIRRDPLGVVIYRFNHLQPGHFYHLDVTLYECDGAGRQESIYIDDYLMAGPVDLGDNQIHRLSLLVDPALYADHEMRISIQAPGIDGAVVSEINLHDIDYRYADSGGVNDPQYPGDRAYGWLDGIASDNWGNLPYKSVRVEQNDNELQYQFDGLEATKNYKLNLVFWQPSGAGRILNVNIDGEFSGVTVDTWDFQIHQESISVPPEAYTSDGSIVVSILRTDASSGAMVNEIALEEETLPSAGACVAPITPYFSQVYGDIIVDGLPAPAGTVVLALNPRGDAVGCFNVGTEGQYGFMRIYGEDTSVNPPISGMRDGELVTFQINGATAVSTPLFYWQDDRDNHQVDLNAGEIVGQSILMQPGWNLSSLNVEPAYPLVDLVLDSIDGRYDLVLGENGVYSPELEPQYNTLHELHSKWGYYIHVTSDTSTNLLAEGLPQPADTPIDLHAGWNWIGYLPEATLPISDALQSIDGQYQLVHSLEETYDPALPEYSTLHEMSPGLGYLIFADTDVTLTYPDTAGASIPLMTELERESFDVEPTECSGLTPSPGFTVVYGEVVIDNQPAPEGTVVAIRTPGGEIAGCSVVQGDGKLLLTHVYGADEFESAGFVEDERLMFVVNGEEVELVTPIYWQDDKTPHEVELDVEPPSNTIYLPLIMSNPPIITIKQKDPGPTLTPTLAPTPTSSLTVTPTPTLTATLTTILTSTHTSTYTLIQLLATDTPATVP